MPLCAAHSFVTFIAEYYVNRPIYARITPLIEELCADSDRDVRFMAEEARRSTGYVEPAKPTDAEEEAEAEAEAERQLAELEREEAEEMKRWDAVLAEQVEQEEEDASKTVTPPADDMW